jgi:hypothetical protein
VPIHVERDPHHNWLLATATGVISLDMVLDLLRTARAPIDRRTMPMLFDASSATTSMIDADVTAAVDVVRQAESSGPRGHVALVAGDNRFYALLLMYEIQCADAGIRFIRVFRQRGDAERWLEVMSAARNLL